MRDTQKCSLKYGKHWKNTELVPYKIVPGV